MNFEVMDVSGDAGIKVYGKTCEEAFVNAGMGMYSLITDVEKINEKQDVKINVKGDSIEELLVGYLNELIFQVDAYGFIGRRIQVDAFGLRPSASLKMRVYGEDFDHNRHEQTLLLKAATYHNLRVEKVNNRWEIEVIFDI
ncbi:archease [Thermodesulfovibrionales bacterium]|nr:archease [Thermodesulfovibrionales bacterium]MCL0037520.1 archease [Thermodesulfovibrionales bacterium]MCL0062315.1 archease [Thermodesulfovibrionales bacterium]MCL0066572.1 archease [Thermodesulfovibrionales bacterium]MCL0068257.1 archease [Thermodesulfovibrionales bacterium]